MRLIRGVIKKGTLLTLSACIFFQSFANAQTAKFATAGTGKMRNYISWFDWAGISIADNTTVNFTTDDGLLINVKFSNVNGPSITPWVMNTWSGSVLWKLYDFADPQVKPALFSQNTIASAGYIMTISVTRDGLPAPFTFVAADAEASSQAEITTLITSGTPWRTIEFFRNSSQNSNPVINCGTQTVDLTLTYGDAPETGQNPILATDAVGSLTVNSEMNRTSIGGMAMAFGVFSPIDRGDLPASYGEAKHGLKFSTTNSCNYNSPFPSISQDAKLALGTVPGDADASQTLDDNASGTDEDAISSFNSYNGSGTYNLSLKVSNTTGSSAYLKGWFDFNRDGSFSENESIVASVANNANTASLLWTNLPSSLPCSSISNYAFRFRLASNLSDIQSPNGYASDGEVEDYFVPDSVIVPPIPHQPTQNLFVCKGNDLKIGALTHPASYLWNNGATTDSIIVNNAGTYWVESSRYGCAVRDSFVVTNYLMAPADFSFEQDACDPKTIEFNDDLKSVKSYYWDFGNSIQSTSSNTIITYNEFGNYNVKFIVAYLNGCVDSISKTISVSNIYDENIVQNKDTTICLGDSILIQYLSPLANFCWSTSNRSMQPPVNNYVSPNTKTIYFLNSEITGTNMVTNGDFSSGNSGFNSDYKNNCTVLANGQYCVGQNVSSCNGHNNLPNDYIMTFKGISDTTLKVWSQTFPVLPNTNYKFSYWFTSLIDSNTSQLHYLINGTYLGATGGIHDACDWTQFYSTWNSSNNTSVTIALVDEANDSLRNFFALDDLYFGEVKMKSDSFVVNVQGLCDSIKIEGDDKICSSTDTLTYSLFRSANCDKQYNLEVDNTFATVVSQTPLSVKLLFKKEGSTTIKATYVNECKIVADSLPVTIKFSPASIKLEPDLTTCRDTSLILNAGNGFTSYVWQDGSTDSTFTVNAPGLYNVTAKNFCGLQIKDSFQFIRSFINPFIVTPSVVNVCKGDSVLFKASGGTNYSWSPATNFDRPNSATSNAGINSSQNFIVNISDSVCLRDTTITIPVAAFSVPNITIAKSNDENCGNDSAVLIANGGISYSWSPSQFIVRNNGNTVTVKPNQNVTYFVQSRDEKGCAGADSVTVYFSKVGDQKLFMPNAFTPNGDGLNDVFKPTFIGPSNSYDFRIYNRWGQLIFKTTTPGVGWDGRYNGIIQRSDTYVFYITAEGGCNGKFQQKETFALIR